jgi:hypothetical protein
MGEVGNLSSGQGTHAQPADGAQADGGTFKHHRSSCSRLVPVRKGAVLEGQKNLTEVEVYTAVPSGLRIGLVPTKL